MPLPPSRPPRCRRSFRTDASGVTAVEFALVAPVVFMLICAILETMAVVVAGMVLDNATSDAARDVLTGQIQEADLDAETFKRKICDATSFMLSCDKIMVDMRTYPNFKAVPTDLPMKLGDIDDSGFCFDPGAADSITVLRAAYEWPWTMAFLQKFASETNGNAILMSIEAFQNEPFGNKKLTHATC
jgi:Flp pilus assembly protein TadG